MIETGIILHDQFTNVVYDIMDSVYVATGAMTDLQQSMNDNIDPSGFESIVEDVEQVTAALDEMNAALRDQQVINTDPNIIPPTPPTMDGTSIPEQPRGPPVEPVEIPVVWSTDGLDVFTSTGIDRFEQEVQSANGMLDQLSSTQNAIARQSVNMDILPAAAVNDLHSMATRVDMLRNSIQQFEGQQLDVGTDTANMQLERLRAQLYEAISAQNDLNAAMQHMDVSAANNAYLRLSQTVSSTEQYIRDNTGEQDRFNRQIQAGGGHADNLTHSIMAAAGAYLSLRTAGDAIGLSDSMTQITARLNLMNDGLQTTDELVNMIYASARSAHAPFLETADSIARMGNNAGAAFNSNQELIAFMDQVNKQFIIGGASAQDQSNAIMQLSQAMAAGALRGDELNSILDAAPGIARAIETSMGWAEGSIKSYAEEGAVTAGVVKYALLDMADETNAALGDMPTTFSQAMTDIRTDAIMAFQPVLQRINDVANSPEFQVFANNVTNSMSIVAGIILGIFDMVAAAGGFISDNWSSISPIVYTVIAALSMYLLYLGLLTAAETAVAAAKGVMAAITGIQTTATLIATAAQQGFNAALLACPLSWMIALIVVVIAVILGLIAYFAKAGGAAQTGFGAVAGAVAMAGAAIWNVMVGLVDLVGGIINFWVNGFIAFANFFANFLNNPVSSIINLIADMADRVLGILESIANAIDSIFGSGLSDAVSGWRSNVKGLAADLIAEYAPDENYQAVFDTIDFGAESLGLERIDYGNAFDAGVTWGDDLANSFNNMASPPINTNDMISAVDGISDGVGDVAGNTGAMADALSASEEDLKYLRDLAEQETVNRYTLAEVKVDMTGMRNTVNNNGGLDDWLSSLTLKVGEAIDEITEGAH